ncbi:hypothetical protein [Yoonia sp. SS1-5]|uniref:Lipoprotein n=1 Tax=Yoonia rhodophyticola TaxID=3137370 RepID=A0AAN0MA23_9RHOB
MRVSVSILVGAAFLVTACSDILPTGSSPDEAFIKELPEGVAAIAAPNQDLQAVKIDPADGCYVYRYAGPVETTFLPLRTQQGRPICGAKPEPQAET